MARRWTNHEGLRYPTLVTALSALVAQACGWLTHNSDGAAEPAPMAGASGSGGGGSGSAGSGGTNILVVVPGGSSSVDPNGSGGCASDGSLFAEQVVGGIGPQRVLYSWTTDEQVAELRAGGELFSRSERPGMGRGLLFTDLAALATGDATPVAQLADKLVNEVFAKARFAWPNPWATLLGVAGESYGNQLLRIELKPDAWIARLTPTGLSVVDSEGQPVSLEQALQSPERIGAIYHEAFSDPAAQCDVGTFSRSAVSFREFAVGNLAMVAHWELATPLIAERLQADIRELRALEQELACATLPAESAWENDTICGWTSGDSSAGSLLHYGDALGLPSHLYYPNAENIEALIAALEASAPTGEALAVTPGQ